MTYKIFISHSHKDADLAMKLDNSLKPRRGFSVFRANYDSELGDKIPKRIMKKIAESHLFIVIWSRNSSKSNWVSQEIGMALLGKLKILPVIHGRGLALPETLTSLEKKGKVISLRGGREEAFNSIKAAIKKDMAGKGFAQKPRRRAPSSPSPPNDDELNEYSPEAKLDRLEREWERDQFY